ncbi:hypothetical protein Trydic_g19446 [Trypoxylus dichotomus]
MKRDVRDFVERQEEILKGLDLESLNEVTERCLMRWKKLLRTAKMKISISMESVGNNHADVASEEIKVTAIPRPPKIC